MAIYIPRERAEAEVRQLLEVFPVTAILGPRQAGKTTLARRFAPDVVFDLENPRHMAALENPQLALEPQRGLILIDEVQRKPELFPLIRYLADQQLGQRFLLLGSASASLRRQSGESLAGRIGYCYLAGLNLSDTGPGSQRDLWLRGGFPRSFLADSDEQSLLWRDNFIATFLERDLAAMGLRLPPASMYRFWLMLSHYHGQVLNYSELGRAFGASDKEVKQYLGLLEDAFMIRILSPWHSNTGKRLVKSPKLYLRDSGIFHALQSIHSHRDLLLHPKLGASWEGFALEEGVGLLGKRESEVFFYASHGGVELDLFWQEGGRSFGAEFKYMDSPRISKSMLQALEDLNLSHLWVIYPGDRAYPLAERITVLPLAQLAGLRQR